MTQRRANRIAAVQFLYMWEANPPYDLRTELRRFFESQEHPREYFAFAEELVNGVIEKIDDVDDIIRKAAVNWEFKRIARIDLAILRLALYEMKHRDDIPPIVSINEAIEMSKLFSTAESKRFVNGILDKYKLQLQRPLRQAND